ncbi:hypothetical protein VU07_03180, partial [Desulfobulbus sp. F4]|nr:hypothetical protein [Desulfobulbus sp. F4]
MPSDFICCILNAGIKLIGCGETAVTKKADEILTSTARLSTVFSASHVSFSGNNPRSPSRLAAQMPRSVISAVT